MSLPVYLLNVYRIENTWTSLSNSVERYASWEADSFSAGKKFSAFKGIRKFVTLSTRSRHWTLSRARWI